MPDQTDPPLIRYLLGGLLAFGAANAFAGGYYGLTGAEGVPTEWLEGSPFRDYHVPSLVLFTVVGGTLLFATIAVFARLRVGRWAALSAGIIRPRVDRGAGRDHRLRVRDAAGDGYRWTAGARARAVSP